MNGAVLKVVNWLADHFSWVLKTSEGRRQKNCSILLHYSSLVKEKINVYGLILHKSGKKPREWLLMNCHLCPKGFHWSLIQEGWEKHGINFQERLENFLLSLF